MLSIEPSTAFAWIVAAAVKLPVPSNDVEATTTSPVVVKFLAVSKAVAVAAFPVVSWLRVSTAITLLVAVKPDPANNVANAVVVVNCSVEPSESNVKNESPLAGVTAENSDKSIAKDTAPELPPPDKPAPAVTADISPVSDILNWPSEALRPEPAIPATKSAIDSFLEPLESSASIIAILSAVTSTAAAARSFKLRVKVAAPPSAEPFAMVEPPLVAFAKVAT